jgi:hypothetical protein
MSYFKVALKLGVSMPDICEGPLMDLSKEEN